MLPGYATPQGTERYRDRFPQLRDARHFRRSENVREAGELWLSSIGLGTYLGEPTDASDAEYVEAIATALRSGINVLDTAINYRHQRSERNLGTALARLVAAGELQRDEVLVCTKAGYLSFDGNLPPDPRAYFRREYVETGILDPAQLAGGMHCLAPRYLENQIERSCTNLGLATLDVFYLHNPESQLAAVSRPVFRDRLKDAFSMLEGLVKEGMIRYYGLATWNAFRMPEDARDHIGLFEIADLARAIAGEHHHLRFVQLPFNLGMPEAYALLNQSQGRKKMSLLTAAGHLGIAVMGSASLHQGQLAHGLPDLIGKILGMMSDAENSIQFARSAPGITTALIGMGHKEHVSANLRPALVPPAPPEEWTRLFTTQEKEPT
jgi:aryl-alcohol dehydrogenase-like predicted oxidoreductase